MKRIGEWLMFPLTALWLALIEIYEDARKDAPKDTPHIPPGSPL